MEKETDKIREAEQTLLTIGTLLMSSGASTGRVRTTVYRIADALGYNIELLITNRSLMLKIVDEENKDFIASLKRTSPHGVNFKLVSGISKMSWLVVQEHWDLDQINREIDRLLALPHYPRILVLGAVSMSGAAFCALFGSKGIELIFAFVATFAGLFVRQEMIKKQFNPYFTVFIASLAATLISGIAVKYNIGEIPENAFSTSVLFLIPGVPLINAFTDLIDGNLLNGIVRAVHGLIIAFAISLGFLCSMYIYAI